MSENKPETTPNADPNPTGARSEPMSVPDRSPANRPEPSPSSPTPSPEKK